MMEICFLSINHSEGKENYEELFIKSQVYITLLKAVRSEDKFIKILAIRSLASLANRFDTIRNSVVKNINIEKLFVEIFRTQTKIGYIEEKIPKLYFLPPIMDYALNFEANVDQMLAFSFYDLMSALLKDKSSHTNILKIHYELILQMHLLDPIRAVRSMAIDSVSSLSNSEQGLHAIAKTNIFPTLFLQAVSGYNVFNEESFNNVKKFFNNFLASQSSMGILAQTNTHFFVENLESENQIKLLANEIVKHPGRITSLLITSSTFALFWAPIRSLIEPLPEISRFSWKVRSFRGIAKRSIMSVAGTFMFISIYEIFKFYEKSITNQNMEYYYTKKGLVQILTIISIGVGFLKIPYTLVPFIFGLFFKPFIDEFENEINFNLAIKN